VYGFLPLANPVVHDGAWAELIVAPEDGVARAPATIDLAAAGASALAGITALLAVDALEISQGDRVLVVGATGGVGSFAVQLAAHAGAIVIAPALPEDEDYLRGLGVQTVLNRNGDVVAATRERHPDGVDALLDLVSYSADDFNVHAATVRPGGRGATPLSAAGDGAGRTNIMATSTPENLERLAGILDSGQLAVHIQRHFDLDHASDALDALAGTHVQGKLGIRVT
jgi:NADPH2:quinone reductase